MGIKEYKTVTEVAGPLLFVENVGNVAYNELVEITLPSGEKTKGQVLDTSKGKAVIQIFGATAGLDAHETSVRFLGETIKIGVSEEMLGRVFTGLGEPRDNGPPIVGEDRLDVNGGSINPYSRQKPGDFIQTGISAIDCMNTLVRGQKLPIFSGAGLPHNRLAMQIARQAAIPGKEEEFAVVVGAIGITFEEAEYFASSLRKTGAIEHSVLFLNLANDPAVERVITPRMALTAAEYLAYDHDMHVLVILTDMTNYCESLKEISAARREIPGRRAYPPYMYTDLATIYERAGKVKGRKGSITQIPILTMPEDDITHPIPDLTGYITEGQLVLSRQLHAKHVYPPFDILKCLSRLAHSGMGKGKTREDHSQVSKRLYSSYAKGVELRELVSVIGEAALTQTDKKYLDVSKRFEKEFLGQKEDERRDIETSLSIAWDLFAGLPSEELESMKPEYTKKYGKNG